MKKVILSLALCCTPLSVFAAQTTVTPIGAFANPAQTSINTLRDATNVKIGVIEANRQDHETRVAAMETGKVATSCFANSTAFNACFALDWPTGFDTAGNYTVTGEWDFTGATVTGISSGGISHASSDGNYYASKDGAWASLTGVFLTPTGSAANLTSFPTLNQSTTGNAATATALATNPTDCTTGQYATTIAANGNLTCGQVAYSQVSGTPTLPTYGTGVVSALGVSPDAAGGFLLYSSYADDPLISWDAATITETVDSPSAGTNTIGVKSGIFQPADAQLDTWAGVTPGTGVVASIATATGAVGGLPTIIASGAYTVDTASIDANTCASAVAVTATGAATTDVIVANPNAILSSVVGFGVTTAGAVRVDVYPTSGNVNFQFCNPTGAAIDPGSVTFNWKVLR